MMMLEFIKNFFRRDIDGFDSDVWKNSPEKRSLYVAYILSHRVGIGKSKEEIEDLFGRARVYLEHDRWSYTIAKNRKRKTSLAFYFKDAKVVNIEKKYSVRLNK